jgi:hypothetical protein
LNWVARVLFEYFPPIWDDLPVIAHTFIGSRYYHIKIIKQM